MSDMVSRDEANTMIREAIGSAITQARQRMKDEVDAAVARAYVDVAATIRGMAVQFVGVDGEQALLRVATSLESVGTKALDAVAAASEVPSSN